jgi:hypothetical protein
VELNSQGDFDDTAAKLARTRPALCIAAGVFAHQHTTFLFTESIADELEVVNQQLALFG